MSTTQEMYDVVSQFKDELANAQKEIEVLKKSIFANLQQTECDLEQGLILNTETPDSVAKKLTELEEKLMGMIDSRQSVIESKLDKLLGDVEKVDRRSLSEIIRDDASAHWQSFKGYATQAVEAVKNTFTAMKEGVQNGITKLAEATKDFFHYAKAVSNEAMGRLADIANRTSAKIDAGIAFTIKQPVADAVNKVETTISNTVQKMRDVVDDTKMAIATAVTKANLAINEGKVNIANKLADKLNEKLSTLNDRQNALAEKLKDDIEKPEKE